MRSKRKDPFVLHRGDNNKRGLVAEKEALKARRILIVMRTSGLVLLAGIAALAGWLLVTFMSPIFVELGTIAVVVLAAMSAVYFTLPAGIALSNLYKDSKSKLNQAKMNGVWEDGQ